MSTSKIHFSGDYANDVRPAVCELSDAPIGASCLRCKYCCGLHVRTWDSYDKDYIKWFNGAYDGYVSCTANESKVKQIVKRAWFKYVSKRAITHKKIDSYD